MFDRISQYIPEDIKSAVLSASPDSFGFDSYNELRTTWSAFCFALEKQVDLDADGIIENDEICTYLGKLVIQLAAKRWL